MTIKEFTVSEAFTLFVKNTQATGFTHIAKVLPSGSLEARRISTGAIIFYWRYTAGGKGGREAIGQYAPRNPPKSLEPIGGMYSLLAAKKAAEVLAGEHAKNKGKGGWAALKAENKRIALANEEARLAREAHTLGDLMALYAATLYDKGKSSHRDVENIVKNHLINAKPKLALKPACEVTPEELASLISDVNDKGKGRTANKLRSYLHAAFKLAAGAKLNPSTPKQFKGYGIAINPIANIPANSNANKADKNPIQSHELQAYWQAIKALEGKRGALLRIHLLTGGLRPQQLLRLKPSDVNNGAFTLHDIKGKRGDPRAYTTPILQCLQDDFKQFASNKALLFSSDGGKTAIRAETLSGWAKEAAGGAIEGFQLKRIRSGVETLLASKRISSDVRAQLQSHGISGVQAKNYDAYHYLPEKREALETLYKAVQND